jgi:hypothetical protein
MSRVAWWITAIVALLALIQTWRVARLRTLGSRRAKTRGRRARDAEHDAAPLLEALGYAVLERQPRASLTLLVDGEPVVVSVRGDLMVRHRGRKLLAEVKDGDLAPRITHGPTRRQLLEYRIAFDVDGVLLVDPARGRVAEIDLPVPEHAEARGARRAWLALLIGIAIGAALAHALAHGLAWVG